MEEVVKDNRKFTRLQLGNSKQIDFALLDVLNDQQASYCICTDLSEAGAHFFTDREYSLQQKLQLIVRKNSQVIEKQTVTVIRADTDLSDEERFCQVVVFDRPLAAFAEIVAAEAGDSGSIAA